MMNLKNKIINISKKINFINISIFLLIIIVVFFTSYQYNSIVPKEVDIKGKILELQGNEFFIEKCSKNNSVIQCEIDKKYFKKEKFRNYVLGNGKGSIINVAILLKKENKYYKLKTVFEDTYSDRYCFYSCINNKYLSGEYEILIYNMYDSKIYVYR